VLVVAAVVFGALAASRAGTLAGALRSAPWTDRWLLLTVGVGVIYTVGTSVAFPSSYPRSALGAIPANLVRASLALLPEAVRYPAIEGLRGHLGGGGRLLGLAVVAGTAALFVWAWKVVGPTSRALLVVAVVDLALPALASGFVIRYAPLAGALVACVAGLELDRRAGARARGVWLAGAIALGLAWTWDDWVDVQEYRREGRLVEDVLDAAAARRRQLGDGVPIALVDLPLDGGRENDIPLFRWGNVWALEHSGAPGPWVVLSTRPGEPSDATVISSRELETWAQERPRQVLVFDPATGRLRAPAGTH